MMLVLVRTAQLLQLLGLSEHLGEMKCDARVQQHIHSSSVECQNGTALLKRNRVNVADLHEKHVRARPLEQVFFLCRRQLTHRCRVSACEQKRRVCLFQGKAPLLEGEASCRWAVLMMRRLRYQPEHTIHTNHVQRGRRTKQDPKDHTRKSHD